MHYRSLRKKDRKLQRAHLKKNSGQKCPKFEEGCGYTTLRTSVNSIQLGKPQ